MKQADAKYIQRMLEMCKYIKWKNINTEEQYLGGKNDEKISRNSNGSNKEV